MNEEEQQIWRAAYAAAFVQDFESLQDTAESMPSQERGGELPFDLAVSRVSAERACTVADLSVTKLREWRKQENHHAGITIEEESGG